MISLPTAIALTNGSLKQITFLSHGRQVEFFYLTRLHTTTIILYLFTYREDKFENLGPVIQSQDSANPGLVHIIKQRTLHDRLGIPISSSSAESISHKLAKRTSKKEFSLDFMMFSYFLFQKVKNSNEEKNSITPKAYLKKSHFVNEI